MSLLDAKRLLENDYALMDREEADARRRRRSGDPVQVRAGIVMEEMVEEKRKGWLRAANEIQRQLASPVRERGELREEIEIRATPSGKAGSIVRSVPGDQVSGYASIFYNGSRGSEFELAAGIYERVGRDAFTKTLNDETERNGIILNLGHDDNFVLASVRGRSLDLKVDHIGLRYTGRLTNSPIDRHVLAHVGRDISGSSFAFIVRATRWEKDGSKTIRVLEDLKLLDVACTPRPAYTGAKSW